MQRMPEDNLRNMGKKPDAKVLGFYNTLRLYNPEDPSEGQYSVDENETVQAKTFSFSTVRDAAAWSIEQDKEFVGYPPTQNALEDFKKASFGENVALSSIGGLLGDINPFGSSGPPQIDSAYASEHFPIQGQTGDADLKEKYYRDTSVGGNDVINPLWQFCENDDIIPAKNAFNIKSNSDSTNQFKRGLGRVYEEMYDRNQQQLEMTFGVPHFSNVGALLANATKKDILNVNKAGDLSIGKFLGGLIYDTYAIAVNIITFPIKFVWDMSQEGARSHVNKYVEFEASMFHYFRKVNTILMSLAQGLGITPKMYQSKDPENPDRASWKDYFVADALPEILQYDCDIMQLLQKRSKFISGAGLATEKEFLKDINENTKSDTLKDKGADVDNPLKRFGNWLLKMLQNFKGMVVTQTTRFIGAGKGNLNFVRFRVTDQNASESFSNSTGETEVGRKLKEASQSGKAREHGWFGGLAEKVGDVVGKTIDVVTAGAFRAEGVISAATGQAMYAIPEVWQDSSFSRSYNFSLQLRSPYGDPISIFQSLYVPLAMLLAGTLPRQAGNNMYSSPFIVRAYSKGQFSIPYGIIESLSVKRGGEEFGWTQDGLPKAIDIEFSIKDLTPVMFLGIADRKLFDVKDALTGNNPFNFLEANDQFQEYLDTLCGIGVAERFDYDKMVFRRAKIAARIAKVKYFGSSYMSSRIGLSGIGQTIAAICPWDDSPYKSSA